jgi:polyphosphate kinase
LAVDSGHPFPRLPNLSFSLPVGAFRPPPEARQDGGRAGAERAAALFAAAARLTTPTGPSASSCPRRSSGEGRATFSQGHEVRSSHAFRLTRNADIDIAEDEADDLLQVIEDEVRKRRWGDAVRLEVTAKMPEAWCDFLRKTLQLIEADVYHVDYHLNVGDFMELALLDLPELRYPPFDTRCPPSSWALGRLRDHPAQDVLIHHPFHSFDAVST